MAKVCMMMYVNGIKPNICIGKECGQWALCNGIQNKPKQAIRTINLKDE